MSPRLIQLICSSSVFGRSAYGLIYCEYAVAVATAFMI